MGGAKEPAAAEPLAVRCKIPPRSQEVAVHAPTISVRIIDVYLVRWVGRRSSPAHDQHEGRGLRECPRERPCLACWSWYIGNGRYEICYRIVVERVAGIDKRSAIPVAATAGVNTIGGGVEVVERDSRYITACDG